MSAPSDPSTPSAPALPSIPAYATTGAGDELPPVVVRVHRSDLVRYAGAAGDFNPIHWNPTAATALGLPGVIAHGMLTMAQAARVVTQWAGDPARVEEYSVRFTSPVVVPDDGVEVVYSGVVKDKLDNGRVRIELSARAGEDKVLGAARATVRLD